MKTIAIVAENLYTGGVGLITLQYANALADLHYDVTLLVIDPSNPEGIALKEKPCLKSLLLYKPCTLNELVSLLESFDMVIISNTAIMPFGLEASRFLRKPFVVEILHTATKAALTPSIDMTVAVSRHIFENMMPRPQDIILPNGIDTSMFYPSLTQSGQRLRVIQIARSGKVMDPDLEAVALELVRRGINIEALVVGREGESGEHIKYLGLQPYEKIPELLRQSNILLHMSLEESFGMTALEAMASGIIPVVSDVGGLKEVVKDNVTGLVVKSRDIGDVADVLCMLIDKINKGDPTIDNLRGNALAVVRECYDLKMIMSSLVDTAFKRAHTKERLNRRRTYPFSFIASFLFLVHRDYDRYFALMEDITFATDLSVALADWRDFSDVMIVNINDRASILTLDGIYKSFVNDIQSTAYDIQLVTSFWLSVIALCVGQIARLKGYLLRSMTQLSSQGLARATLAVLSQYQIILGKTPAEELYIAGSYIKECYISGRHELIEDIPLDMSTLKTILQWSGFSGLLDLINEDNDG